VPTHTSLNTAENLISVIWILLKLLLFWNWVSVWSLSPLYKIKALSVSFCVVLMVCLSLSIPFDIAAFHCLHYTRFRKKHIISCNWKVKIFAELNLNEFGCSFIYKPPFCFCCSNLYWLVQRGFSCFKGTYLIFFLISVWRSECCRIMYYSENALRLLNPWIVFFGVYFNFVAMESCQIY
jgi:hypothetical protein